MEHVKPSTSNPSVSRVPLGLAHRNQTDSDAIDQTIWSAIERRINFLDSANDSGRTPNRPYGGPSEEALSRAIVGCRDEMVITSKVYWNLGDRPESIGSSHRHIMQEIAVRDLLHKSAASTWLLGRTMSRSQNLGQSWDGAM